MFSNVIRQTSLTSDAANNLFGHIFGNDFNGDHSFISTLRALTYPRVDKDGGEGLFLSFTETTCYNRSYIVNNDKSGLCDRIVQYLGQDFNKNQHTLIIHNMKMNSVDNTTCMDIIESELTNLHPEFTFVEKATMFFRKSIRILCFVDHEHKTSVVFTDGLTMQKMHYIQCGIFAFLPWLFDQEDGVSELEMKLINSVREKTPDSYIDCINKFAELYDVRKNSIRNMLSGFETRYEKDKIREVKNNIDDIMRKIDDINGRLGQLIKIKNENDTLLMALELKVNNADDSNSEIMDYFLCNDNLVLEYVSNSDFGFSCKGYLEYYDEEMAKSMIDNNRSYVYMNNRVPYRSSISSEDMRLLMTSIFIDQKLRIKFCASYQFSLHGSVRANSRHTYGSEFWDCTPNTHTDAYSCMGNYVRMINELLLRKDYIGAIEQCVASCKSLNFGDSTVMNEFMRRMYCNGTEVNMKCIELPDGSVVNPVEAIKYLKQEASQSNE